MTISMIQRSENTSLRTKAHLPNQDLGGVPAYPAKVPPAKRGRNVSVNMRWFGILLHKIVQLGHGFPSANPIKHLWHAGKLHEVAWSCIDMLNERMTTVPRGEPLKMVPPNIVRWLWLLGISGVPSVDWWLWVKTNCNKLNYIYILKFRTSFTHI